LLITALNRSSNSQVKRGIYQYLRSTFDFERLQSVSTKAEFGDTMRAVAASSKPYFRKFCLCVLALRVHCSGSLSSILACASTENHAESIISEIVENDVTTVKLTFLSRLTDMSGKYFDTEGRGMLQLWGDMEFFTEPKISGEISFGTANFSMTAWVRTVPQFLDGYILRKRPSPGSSQSCVGWYLHRNFGLALHYGAHDFDPLSSPFETKTQVQFEAKPEAQPFEPDIYALLTMVVTSTTVQFFKNTKSIGSAPLPRPSLTDCFNGGEGTLIGDPGLELGVVRYYPFSLTSLQIEEVRPNHFH
jgi:hypothetical protein